MAALELLRLLYHPDTRHGVPIVTIDDLSRSPIDAPPLLIFGEVAYAHNRVAIALDAGRAMWPLYPRPPIAL